MEPVPPPPPPYVAETTLGETTLKDNTIQAQAKNIPQTTEARNMVPVQRAPSRLSNISNPPYLMPGTGLPLTYGGPETPLPYSTAPVTPLYNTPHATPMPPGGPQTGYGGYGMQPNQMMMCVPSMPNYGMQMQPMYMPQLPTNPAPSQNGGINLVVNTNANASGNATGCKGAANERMCPKCRKGSIIRAQQRKGEIIIKTIAYLTFCCTCYLPLRLLKKNYVDKCSFCGKEYGHKGPKVEKLKKT